MRPSDLAVAQQNTAVTVRFLHILQYHNIGNTNFLFGRFHVFSNALFLPLEYIHNIPEAV